MKRIRLTRIVITWVFVVGLFAHIALARPAILPDYKTMAEDAHLVAIATPISRAELKDLTTVPGVRRGNDPIPAVAINTTFSPVTILKGVLPKGEKDFVLRHLREKNPQEVQKNAPMLIDFVPNDGSQYLMFLRRRVDGTYEAVNGQVDPARCIEKLQHQLPKRKAAANKGIDAEKPLQRGLMFHGLSLADAPRTSKTADLDDLWEAVPPGSRSYEMRKDVVVVYVGFDGTVYKIPKKNIFYVQHDPLASSRQTFYGPFVGDPAKVLNVEMNR